MTASKTLDGLGDLLSSRLANLMQVIEKPEVIEVMINQYGEVIVELTDGSKRFEKAPWVTREWAGDVAQFLSIHFDLPYDEKEKPILRCQLPGGHRLNLVLGTNVSTGISAAVRVKRPFRATPEHFGVAETSDIWQRIRAAMEGGQSIVVSGGTSSGKTTLLRVLVRMIPAPRRVILVEDVPEIDLPHRDKVHLFVSPFLSKTKMSFAEAIDIATRSRPDVVGVGEINTSNVEAYMRIAGSGHDSAFTTIHAGTPWQALRAFRRNVQMTGKDPSGIIEELADLVHLIVQVKQVHLPDGGYTRRITDVAAPRDLPQVRALLRASGE